MKPGSVIVDMAAGQGGNVAGSVADELVVTANGVTIIGYTDLAGRLPAQASQLYGTNLVNLLKLLTPGKDGQLVLDFDDVVQRSMTVVRDGREDLAAAAGAGLGRARPPRRRRRRWSRRRRRQPPPPARRFAARRASAAALLFLLTAFSPNELIGHFTVFALAVVVGFYVIGHVHHALHTPLMSVTNAISGIIVVGALLQIGHDDTAVTVLAFVGDPAGQHQRLRRLRRDPPDARHVHPRPTELTR